MFVLTRRRFLENERFLSVRYVVFLEYVISSLKKAAGELSDIGDSFKELEDFVKELGDVEFENYVSKLIGRWRKVLGDVVGLIQKALPMLDWAKKQVGSVKECVLERGRCVGVLCEDIDGFLSRDGGEQDDPYEEFFVELRYLSEWLGGVLDNLDSALDWLYRYISLVEKDLRDSDNPVFKKVLSVLEESSSVLGKVWDLLRSIF